MELSLCLEMLFRDRPFAARMEAAARLGYRAVEFWDWRDKDIDEVKRQAGRLGLTVAAMSGNRRHALVDPAARAGLIEEMGQVFDVAGRLGCRNIMMLSDALAADGSATPTAPLAEQEKLESMVDGLRALADQLEDRSLMLLVEPLNIVLDHRGCFLSDSDTAVEVARRVDRPRVRVLYDVYHMSMMDENAAAEIERKIAWIGYLHVADMPGRHEPGTGRIDYAAVRAALERAGYAGYLGMEFSALASEQEAARRPLGMFR